MLSLTCKQCGAGIEIGEAHAEEMSEGSGIYNITKNFFCPFCGVKHMINETVQKYVPLVTNITHNVVQTIDTVQANSVVTGIVMGDVSGTGIAIGNDARAAVNQSVDDTIRRTLPFSADVHMFLTNIGWKMTASKTYFLKDRTFRNQQSAIGSFYVGRDEYVKEAAAIIFKDRKGTSQEACSFCGTAFNTRLITTDEMDRLSDYKMVAVCPTCFALCVQEAAKE